MKLKKQAFGIISLDGSPKNIIYIDRTRNGFVIAIPELDYHVTVVDEGDTLSSHTTHHKTDDRKRLGVLVKDSDFDSILEDTFKIRILREDEYDRPVMYWTKKGIELFGEPQHSFVEIETKDYVGHYFDLLSTVAEIRPLVEEFMEKPELYFGECKAGDILSNEDIMVGFVSQKVGIMEFNGDLYEMELSALLDPFKEDIPLARILEPFGLIAVYPDIQKRLQEILRLEI